MKIIIWDEIKDEDRSKILGRANIKSQNDIREYVYDIIINVKQFGDLAVKAYTNQFDGVELKKLSLSEPEWEVADQIDDEAKLAINFAYKNIKRFHELQMPNSTIQILDNIYLCKEYRAIESVGSIYLEVLHHWFLHY